MDFDEMFKNNCGSCVFFDVDDSDWDGICACKKSKNYNIVMDPRETCDGHKEGTMDNYEKFRG